MNKIDKLIEELCPNGVEFKNLENCCNILDNKRKPVTKSERESGEYPYYGANGIQDYVSNYIFDGKFVLVGEDGSVINDNGNPIVTWAEGKIWVNNHAHIIEEIDEVSLRYLYHYIQTINVTNLIHGNIPKLNQGDFRKLQIAVPPLEVQSEIVHILDDFTLLSAELSAELKARQKQYEYYRDYLINNTNGEEKEICEIFKRIKGTPITAGKMKEIANDEGNIRVFAGGKTMIDAFERDIPNANITNVPAVLVQSRGLIDFIYYDKPFTFKNEMWAYTSDNVITTKYLFYVLKNNMNYFRKAASGMGSMPQISLPVTEKFKIKIPSIKEQEKIVNTLDRFEKLCNDISDGLPAEINARNKQYEFYRDKFLTFKVKE